MGCSHCHRLGPWATACSFPGLGKSLLIDLTSSRACQLPQRVRRRQILLAEVHGAYPLYPSPFSADERLVQNQEEDEERHQPLCAHQASAHGQYEALALSVPLHTLCSNQLTKFTSKSGTFDSELRFILPAAYRLATETNLHQTHTLWLHFSFDHIPTDVREQFTLFDGGLATHEELGDKFSQGRVARSPIE